MKDDLIDSFDYPLICIKGINYMPDSDDFAEMAKIFNKWLFNNSLKDIWLRCCMIDDINFDLQESMLDAGIFELGIDVISCNAMAIAMIKDNICKCKVSFNHSIYTDVQFDDVCLDVIDMLHWCNETMKDCFAIYEALEKNDISILCKSKFDTKYLKSELGYDSKYCIKHIEPRFNVIDLLGASDVQVMSSKDIVIMKRQKLDKILAIKFI